MTQYIDKAAVMAEIERRKKELIELSNDFENRWACRTLDNILSFLDTLEVKEVDLERKFSQWWKDERAKNYNVDILYEKYPNVSMKLARHFFELGLKTQMKE